MRIWRLRGYKIENRGGGCWKIEKRLKIEKPKKPKILVRRMALSLRNRDGTSDDCILVGFAKIFVFFGFLNFPVSRGSWPLGVAGCPHFWFCFLVFFVLKFPQNT